MQRLCAGIGRRARVCERPVQPRDYVRHWRRRTGGRCRGCALVSAAEQGFANAQYNLGIMYDTGDGVPEDDVLAYMWANLAAAQGHENAQEIQNIIEERMTREQIAEAQRMSREWIEEHSPGGN